MATVVYSKPRFFLNIQQKNQSVLSVVMAAGGLDLGISYLKGRVHKTRAHSGLIKKKQVKEQTKNKPNV